ncbi:hypothetical protein [Aquimarina hainanensis]
MDCIFGKAQYLQKGKVSHRVKTSKNRITFCPPTTHIVNFIEHLEN